MKRFAAVTGCLLAVATTAMTIHVTGRVLDDNRPVAGADVEFALATGMRPSVTARTDSAGEFSVLLVEVGIYRLRAKRVGYEPAESTVTVAAGGDTTVTIQLHRIAQRLDSVVVVDPRTTPARYGAVSRMDDFYARRARGVGKFFTRDELDSLAESSLATLLRRVPGVRVSTGMDSLVVHFARCQGALLPIRGSADNGTTSLFIDGTQISSREIPQTLASLRLSQIEALEVFRSPTELPIQAMGNACGAIFVWMKFGPQAGGARPDTASIVTAASTIIDPVP